MILDKVFQEYAGRGSKSDLKLERREKFSRSVAKSISWRIIGTLDTIFISWLVTGTIKLALSIGLVELVTKMTLYIVHERVWNNIKWGNN